MLTRDRAELSCQTFVVKVTILTRYFCLAEMWILQDMAPVSQHFIKSRERRIVVPSARFPADPATRPPKRWISTRLHSISRPAELRLRHHQRTLPTPTTSIPTNTANMPGVSVRDVQADKFINAYAAFLKRQGKLPIPGS